MRLIWDLVKPIVRVLFWLLTRRQIKREKNPIPQGPLIIVANHVSMVDVPLLGISLPRRIAFMGKQELFRSRVQSFLWRSLGGFPVHRGQFDREALRKANEQLKKGWALGVFPEGKRSPNAQLQPPYPGAAFVAFHTAAPILPVGIVGTEKFRNMTWIFRRPRLTVNIGEPFTLPSIEGKLTSAQLDSLTDFIMERVAELLPENYRGVYAGNSKD